MTAALELLIVSITATIVIGAMLFIARGMYRKRIPDAGWVDGLEPTQTVERRYREVQGE